MKIESIQLLLNLNFKNIEQLDVKQLNTKSMMNAIAHFYLYSFLLCRKIALLRIVELVLHNISDVHLA